MRTCCAVMILFLVGGCAARPRPWKASRPQAYVDASSPSFVFTPPVALGIDDVDLPRDQRTPRAFVGYDEVSTSYFRIWTDDRQTNDGTDRYVRRSTIERVGISYR